MTMDDFYRLTDVIKRKIYLLIGRAILTAIVNSEKTQKIQVTLLKDETVSDIERFQEYGFETYPKKGSAEAVIAFLNGNRDHGIVLCVHDREYRPLDLSEGDVRVYDYRGNMITCKSTGIEIECLNGNKIEMISDRVKVNGTNLEVLL
jgi:phage baseplate assembly protein V